MGYPNEPCFATGSTVTETAAAFEISGKGLIMKEFSWYVPPSTLSTPEDVMM